MVGVCFVVFKIIAFAEIFRKVFSEIATFFLVFERRATARTTTFVEPRSIQIKRNKQKDPTSADQSKKAETSETGSRSHYLVHKLKSKTTALTTSSAACVCQLP